MDKSQDDVPESPRTLNGLLQIYVQEGGYCDSQIIIGNERLSEWLALQFSADEDYEGALGEVTVTLVIHSRTANPE